MAHVIYRVGTINVTKGLRDGELQRKLKELTKKKQEDVAKSGGGALHNVCVHYIDGKHPRYKVIISFLRFSPG